MYGSIGKKLRKKDNEHNLSYQISRYRHGDKEAFNEIFRQYCSRLYRFLVIFTDGSSSVEDILQETFLRVAMHLHTLKDESKFKEWIFAVCRNTAITYRKKEVADAGLGELHPLVDREGPEEQAVRSEREKLVREALSRLTEDQRTVILLSRYEGMNYREIAAIMERNENSIKALAHRAMTRLGEFLERNRDEL